MTAEAEAVLDLTPTPPAPEPAPVPPGWQRLPAGPVRRVKVWRQQVGEPEGLPFDVRTERDDLIQVYAGVVVEGESRLVHVPQHQDERGCTVRGAVYLETAAALLVCRTPAALVAKVG